MYKVDKTSNVVFSLCYHLIVVVKYRQDVFDKQELVNDMKYIVEEIAQDFYVEVLEQACGVDHIHILFRAKPTWAMTKFVNSLKGVSSRNLRQKYKDTLKHKLWESMFGLHHIFWQQQETLP